MRMNVTRAYLAFFHVAKCGLHAFVQLFEFALDLVLTVFRRILEWCSSTSEVQQKRDRERVVCPYLEFHSAQLMNNVS